MNNVHRRNHEQYLAFVDETINSELVNLYVRNEHIKTINDFWTNINLHPINVKWFSDDVHCFHNNSAIAFIKM